MAKMRIELDTEDENYINVTTSDGILTKTPLDSKKIKLKIDKEEIINSIPSHTPVWSKGSPGCINYIHNGQLYRV
jgi:hypothetical protein